jgi:putative membrane protein
MPDVPEKDPRVYFAAERTLLAWIRTGLAMMGFGFVVARFGLFLRGLQFSHGSPAAHSTHFSFWFGTALVLMGAMVTLLGALQYRRSVHRLQQGTWSPGLSRSGMVVAIVLTAAGIAVVTYLLRVG